jgi:hypothetical protein
MKSAGEHHLELFATRDEDMRQRARRQHLKNVFPWVLTFDKVFNETEFVDDMRDILKCLNDAYEYPVDIEFTANFINEDSYRINLVQCRPFQAKGDVSSIEAPAKKVNPGDLFLNTNGPIIGTSVQASVDRLVYVVPSLYSDLRESDRYAVARLIGKITHLQTDEHNPRIMLVGPGRWATTTPSLGVPVSFAEINTVSIICEVALMHEGLVPDVSLGTHFFNDLVEMDMLYCAVYPEREGNVFNGSIVEQLPNALTDLLPEASKWSKVVRVIEKKRQNARQLRVYMDSMKQKGICYFG